MELYRYSFKNDFGSMCEAMVGPCVVIEVRTENAVHSLRKVCGPHNPEEARQINPQSIRAVFGKTLAENAVHCTDLPEDGVIESEYFFAILKSNKYFV
jgi:nucleoside-diphosphate kinase